MEHDATTLRVLAERTRQAAEEATNPELRQLLLDTAAEFERWAALVMGLSGL